MDSISWTLSSCFVSIITFVAGLSCKIGSDQGLWLLEKSTVNDEAQNDLVTVRVEGEA